MLPPPAQTVSRRHLAPLAWRRTWA